MSISDHLRRGEIVAAHDGTNLYDVKLPGAMYIMSRVPCLNFANACVGMNVVVDMADPQTPTIVSVSSDTSRWLGLPEPSPMTIDDVGWHQGEGTYDHGGFISPAGADYVGQWEMPYWYRWARAVSWSDTDGLRREAIVTMTENNSVTAIDAKNYYTLASSLDANDNAPRNSTAASVSISFDESGDIGKRIIVRGEDENNVYQSELIPLVSGRYGSGSKSFTRIYEVEVHKTVPVGTQGAWTTLVGEARLSCGSIYVTIPAGTQIQYLGEPVDIKMAPVIGSYDHDALANGLISTLSIRKNSFLHFGNEMMQVLGVDGTTVKVGARGCFKTTATTHAYGDGASVVLWAAPGASVFIKDIACIYKDILYVPSYIPKVGTSNTSQCSILAIDVRTGEYLWNMPTYGEASDSQIGTTDHYHIGIVPDKVPNPSDLLATPDPIIVFDPVDASKWNPTGTAYMNTDAATKDFEEGYVVHLNQYGGAALNRRTGVKLWEKAAADILPYTAGYPNTVNSTLVSAYISAQICTLPTAFTVFPYYQITDVIPNGSTNQCLWAMCYRIVDSKTGNVVRDELFRIDLDVNRKGDGGYGTLRSVPSPDNTGIDYVTIINVHTEYDVPPGYPSSSIQSTSSVHYTGSMDGPGELVKSGYVRIMSHRVASDGTVTKVYDTPMDTFPAPLVDLASVCHTTIGVYDEIPSGVMAWASPPGYMHGNLGADYRRLVYLIREGGYRIIGKAVQEDVGVYIFNFDGSTWYDYASNPLDPDIKANSTFQYTLKKQIWIARAYVLGVRAMIVDPYQGKCTAASSEYIDDPSATQAADEGGTLESLQNTVLPCWNADGGYTVAGLNAAVAGYSSSDPSIVAQWTNMNAIPSLRDYAYHYPLRGLAQNVLLKQMPTGNTMGKTFRVELISTNNGSSTLASNNTYMTQSTNWLIGSNFYVIGGRYMYTCQLSDSGVLFGLQKTS